MQTLIHVWLTACVLAVTDSPRSCSPIGGGVERLTVEQAEALKQASLANRGTGNHGNNEH